MSKVLGTIQVQFTEDHLKSILKVLNHFRDEEGGEQQITIEQVLANPKLLQYIMDEWERGADRDVHEIRSADGWDEINDYL